MTPPPTLSIDHLLHERAWLARLCTGLVRDPAEADDLAQEAMLRALGADSAASAHAKGKLRGWLTSTVRHVALESRRRAGRRRGRELAVALPGAVEATPESAMVGAELRERLARHVMRLPDDERMALVLRYYEGLRPAEISARIGGVSEGAIRQRIHRGMERLRRNLDVDSEQGRSAWFPAALAVVHRAKADASVSEAAALGGGAASPWAFTALAAGALLAACLTLFAVRPTDKVTRVPGVSMGPIEPPGDDPVIAARQESAAGDPTRREITPLAVGTRAERTFRLLHPTTGQPIQGAEWYALATGEMDPEPFVALDGEYLPPAPLLASGFSDSEGHLSVPAQQLDAYQLIVCRGSGHATGSFAVDAKRLFHGPTELRPPLGATLSCRFVDDSGAPLRGAEVIEFDIQERVRPVGTTDEEGRIRITGVGEVPRQILPRDDGTWVHTWSDRSRFYVRAKEGHPWVEIRQGDATGKELSTELPSQPHDLGVMTVPGIWTLRGVVFDEEGAPVAGARVRTKVGFGSVTRAIGSRPGIDMPARIGPRLDVFAETNAMGQFELSLSRRKRASRLRIFAVTDDGRRGQAFLEPEPAELIRPLAPIIVSSEDHVRFALKDRQQPDERLELPAGVPRMAGIRSPIGRANDYDPRAYPLLKDDVLSIRRSYLGSRRRPCSIELEVPGYEPTIVDVRVKEGDQTVFLDRRPRAELTVQFRGDAPGRARSVDLILVSEKPASFDSINKYSRGLRNPPVTAYAGGLALNLREEAHVEFAWPTGRHAWIIAYSSPTGVYETPQPTVVGPMLRPKDGTALEIHLDPLAFAKKNGDRDLTTCSTVEIF